MVTNAYAAVDLQDYPIWAIQAKSWNSPMSLFSEVVGWRPEVVSSQKAQAAYAAHSGLFSKHTLRDCP